MLAPVQQINTTITKCNHQSPLEVLVIHTRPFRNDGQKFQYTLSNIPIKNGLCNLQENMTGDIYNYVTTFKKLGIKGTREQVTKIQ